MQSWIPDIATWENVLDCIGGDSVWRVCRGGILRSWTIYLISWLKICVMVVERKKLGKGKEEQERYYSTRDVESSHSDCDWG